MTHEFGHAFNLSNSQVNGPMVYFNYPARRNPGVRAASRHMRAEPAATELPASAVETMFPIPIRTATAGGR